MPKIITKKSSYGSFSWDHVLCRHCIYGTSFAPNGRPHKVTQHRYPSWSFFGSHFRGLQKLAWQSFCAYFGWLLLPEMWSNFYKHFSSDVIVFTYVMISRFCLSPPFWERCDYLLGYLGYFSQETGRSDEPKGQTSNTYITRIKNYVKVLQKKERKKNQNLTYPILPHDSWSTSCRKCLFQHFPVLRL